MALIECPECKHNISDQAEICPNCGYGLNKKNADKIISKEHINTNSNEKKMRVFTVIWFFISVVSLISYRMSYISAGVLHSHDSDVTGVGLSDDFFSGMSVSSDGVLACLLPCVGLISIVTCIFLIKKNTNYATVKLYVQMEVILFAFGGIVPFFHIKYILTSSGITGARVGIGCVIGLIIGVLSAIIYFVAFEINCNEMIIAYQCKTPKRKIVVIVLESILTVVYVGIAILYVINKQYYSGMIWLISAIMLSPLFRINFFLKILLAGLFFCCGTMSPSLAPFKIPFSIS